MGTESLDILRSLGLDVDRGLGSVQLVSNHTLSPFSEAGFQAADNLLAKAKRRFLEGDEQRATALVDRAAALPYDSHEEAAPAALAAHMMLFSAVTDELERSEESDVRWLQAALLVLEGAQEQARWDLRDVLVAIRQDYHLSKQEERAIEVAIASVPAHTELSDMGPVSPEELSPHLMAILRATVAYEAAMGGASGNDPSG